MVLNWHVLPADARRKSGWYVDGQALWRTVREAVDTAGSNGALPHAAMLRSAEPWVRGALAQGMYGTGPGMRPLEVATLP